MRNTHARVILVLAATFALVVGLSGTSFATDNTASNQCASNDSGTHLEQSATRVSESQIDVSWKDYCSNEDEFHVRRSTDNATFADVTTVAGSPSSAAGDPKSYSDTSVACGATYYYQIRAHKHAPGEQSSDSASVSATATPNAPSGLAVAANADNTKLDLMWTDNSACEDEFHIERQNPDLTWSQVGTSSTASFTDTGLTCNTLYNYRVRAHHHTSNTFSAYSGEASGTTGICTSVSSGKDAPAVANEYLRGKDATYLANCMANQGTNKNKSNWHGNVISKIAQKYNSLTTTWTDADVHADVDYLCNNSGGTL